VKDFIETNKHLPEIPSAMEMEEKGIDMAEMSNLLLQKIEELTLYIIEQDAKLKAQNEQLQFQNQRISELENK
jgi:hypothetical protein